MNNLFKQSYMPIFFLLMLIVEASRSTVPSVKLGTIQWYMFNLRRRNRQKCTEASPRLPKLLVIVQSATLRCIRKIRNSGILGIIYIFW